MEAAHMRTRLGSLAATVLLSAACDFKVTNPGPVQDTFLDDAAAFPAIVNGAGRNLSDALNWVSYTGAAVARELHPAGSTGSFGISVQQQNGRLMDDEVNDHWFRAHQARWTAEQGLVRLRDGLKADFAKSRDAAQLLLWVGYANRLLGENMCDAVIDGGAKQPYTVYLERAEAAFTEAIAVATAAGQASMVTAATAGRASVRALRGNWTGAATDAATVPNGFVYQMPYNTIDIDQYNRIFWASANAPYRAHTVWRTFYEDYYKTTKDPRVGWDLDPKNPTGDAAVGNLGRVPWYFQTKFKVRESPINLSSGWEMRLIEAEAKLVANDLAGAAPLINARRVSLGLTPWPATNATEAWTALKRERGIELWLEARRLGDLRRWATANRPGVVEDMAGRDLCFPVSRNEKETNPSASS
jgi:starch-binding outer membrane protein, SusD/RagB family